MTILEALQWGQKNLRGNNEPLSQNPMLDTQALLSFCIQKPTSYLFSHFEDELPDSICKAYQRIIERRKRHEPISHILGKKEFYKREFLVNQFVLIPRPETELLVETALALASDNATFFDVGTGSGAIAINLAAESCLTVIATDIDCRALEIAKQNSEHHQTSNLISFLSGNLLEPFVEKNIHLQKSEQTIIVANLPYLPISHWLALAPDVKNYEPKIALASGVDGLDAYDKLLQQIKKQRAIFSTDMTLIIEIDPSQYKSAPILIKEYFADAKITVSDDLSGQARMVVAKI